MKPGFNGKLSTWKSMLTVFKGFHNYKNWPAIQDPSGETVPEKLEKLVHDKWTKRQKNPIEVIMYR